MIKILADHDLEGYAITLFGLIAKEEWLDLIEIELLTFEDVGLSMQASDREVWRFAQVHGLILLTNNRNMKDEDSLEQTLRDENRLTSLPVLTIGNRDRLSEKDYRLRCVNRLIEVVIYLEENLGRGRIFIP